jgi:hypothetical protein
MTYRRWHCRLYLIKRQPHPPHNQQLAPIFGVMGGGTASPYRLLIPPKPHGRLPIVPLIRIRGTMGSLRGGPREGRVRRWRNRGPEVRRFGVPSWVRMGPPRRGRPVKGQRRGAAWRVILQASPPTLPSQRAKNPGGVCNLLRLRRLRGYSCIYGLTNRICVSCVCMPLVTEPEKTRARHDMSSPQKLRCTLAHRPAGLRRPPIIS